MNRHSVALVIAVACGVALVLAALANWKWNPDVRAGVIGGGIIAAAFT